MAECAAFESESESESESVEVEVELKLLLFIMPGGPGDTSNNGYQWIKGLAVNHDGHPRLLAIHLTRKGTGNAEMVLDIYRMSRLVARGKGKDVGVGGKGRQLDVGGKGGKGGGWDVDGKGGPVVKAMPKMKPLPAYMQQRPPQGGTPAKAPQGSFTQQAPTQPPGFQQSASGAPQFGGATASASAWDAYVPTTGATTVQALPGDFSDTARKGPAGEWVMKFSDAKMIWEWTWVPAPPPTPPPTAQPPAQVQPQANPQASQWANPQAGQWTNWTPPAAQSQSHWSSE